jgi:DNA-binding transcriptional LysR family regulator
LPPALLKVLRTVCEFRSVSHAARRLHMGQAQLRCAVEQIRSHVGAHEVELIGKQIVVSPRLREHLAIRGSAR